MKQDVRTNVIPPLKFGEKFGFLTFSTASNVVYQFKSIYYLFFLTNVLKIDVLVAGMILTIGTVWDAVNDPLIGFWSVNHKFKNGERCRPFALWFAVPWAVSVVLLFCDFKTSQTAAVILALVIYFIFESFNTFVAIPYNSMGGLATNRDADRRSINVYRNLGGCIGSGIGAVACLPLLKLFGALDNGGNLIDGSSSRGFLLTAMVMGAVCIVGSLTHYFTTKERVVQISDDEDHVSARSAAKMLFRCKSWVLNMLYIICYGVNNVLIMSSITYYATYVMGSTGAATIFGATGGVMEAALRTAVELVTGETLEKVEFHDVRGTDGIKEASYDVGGLHLNVCVASGLTNCDAVLKAVQSGEKHYDFIEFMACPGGCVNGGGQPTQPASVRNFTDLKALRAAALYGEDDAKAIRKSHENPLLKKVYAEYLGEPGGHKAHHILHTSYVAREKLY